MDPAENERTLELISKALEKIAQLLIQSRISFEPNQFGKSNGWVRIFCVIFSTLKMADEGSLRSFTWMFET
jgi:hypothetical protein